MEVNIERMLSIWNGPFADRYSDKPRLCAMIRDAELDLVSVDFNESGLDEEGGMFNIIMYVMNDAQKDWIEENVLLDMQDTFAEMAGLEAFCLTIDVMK